MVRSTFNIFEIACPIMVKGNRQPQRPITLNTISGTERICLDVVDTPAPWIAVMWGGSIEFKTPILLAIGFIFVFTIGGVTGVVLPNPGVDRSFQDSYYLVAHFYNVLSLGAVFSIFAGWYYSFPKITGYMYSEGKLHQASGPHGGQAGATEAGAAIETEYGQ
jgi:hypothetical protein